MADPTAVMSSAMPWGAALNAVGTALATPPAGPSEAKSAGSIGTNFDGSGYTVTYGDNSGVDSMRSQSAPGVSTSGGNLSDSSGLGLPNLGGALAGIKTEHVLILVAVVVLMKRRKKS